MFPFDNSYARLPERFFARVPPTPVSAPALIRLNESLALQLGLSPERLSTPRGIEVLAGNRVPQGALVPATYRHSPYRSHSSLNSSSISKSEYFRE